MVEINLLPWREQRRQYEQKVMRLIIGGSLLLMLMVIIGMHVILSMQIKRKEWRVQQLQTAMDSLPDSVVTNQNNQIIAEQLSGIALVKLLNDAARAVDSGVCYQRITHHDNLFELEGRALSMQSMTSGLQVLGQSPFFSTLRLRDLKKNAAQDDLQFVMSTFNDERGA